MDKIIDLLKRSNRYKHLIGGFLVGICALSGQNSIYAARRMFVPSAQKCRMY